TIDLNIRCRTHINTFSFFAPFPGTKLGEMCEQDYGFNGNLEEIPREFQEKLADSISMENKELIERIGKCAHLFVSYPYVYKFAKLMLKVIPSYRLKCRFMDIFVKAKNELIKKGNAGLP